MSNFKKQWILAAVLMAPTTLVQAADIIVEPAPEPFPQEVVPVGVVGGWYIRGDIGYGWADTDVSYQPGYIEDFQSFSRDDLGNAWILEGGLGYQINDFFRVDGTVAYYHGLDFDGRSSSKSSFDCRALEGVDTYGATGDCSVSDTGDLSAFTYMANAYLDLGTYNGFTPYVGAGMGAAHVKWSDLDNDISCKGSSCTSSDGKHDRNTHYDSSHGGISETRFAWALHAGASYDITCRVKADFGYSYTSIEGGDMFGFPEGGSLVEDGRTDPGTQGYSSDINIHSASVGLRYALDDAGCGVPVYEQPEVVYK